MTVAFISHPDCLRHDVGPVHPESPARLWAINDQLIASRLETVLRHYDAPAATRAQLERVHDAGYIDRIERAVPPSGMIAIDPETLMSAHSLSACLHAAGAAALGVDLVMRGEAEAAFCSVRLFKERFPFDELQARIMLENFHVGCVVFGPPAQ